jgi:hypothetical protein
MYTLEIGGRPIATINASSEAEAAARFGEPSFRDDLRFFESGDKPLWTGSEPLIVRSARPEEVNEFERSLAEATPHGHADAEGWVAFLVPVVDPTDDEA